MTRWVWKNGKFEQGKAAPELKPEHIRALPEELTTKDCAEADKVHELDPPHVVEQIVYDDAMAKADAAAKADADGIIKKIPCAKPGERVKLSQREVDVVIARVILGSIRSNPQRLIDAMRSGETKIKHLWFPQDEVNIYELRDGRPPADADRPKHMRGLRLWVDITNPPEWIQDIMRASATNIFDFARSEQQKHIDAQSVLNELETSAL